MAHRGALGLLRPTEDLFFLTNSKILVQGLLDLYFVLKYFFPGLFLTRTVEAFPVSKVLPSKAMINLGFLKNILPSLCHIFVTLYVFFRYPTRLPQLFTLWDFSRHGWLLSFFFLFCCNFSFR